MAPANKGRRGEHLPTPPPFLLRLTTDDLRLVPYSSSSSPRRLGLPSARVGSIGSGE